MPSPNRNKKRDGDITLQRSWAFVTYLGSLASMCISLMALVISLNKDLLNLKNAVTVNYVIVIVALLMVLAIISWSVKLAYEEGILSLKCRNLFFTIILFVCVLLVFFIGYEIGQQNPTALSNQTCLTNGSLQEALSVLGRNITQEINNN